MTAALALLSELHRHAVACWVDGSDLRLRGSAGALTDEFIGRVRPYKAALIELLRRPDPLRVGRLDAWDGSDYPEAGASLVPSTHTLAEIPVVRRVHLSDEHAGGFRHEILRCKQPDGDGLLGWAVVNDDCYLSIVRERGVVRTLSGAASLRSAHLRELRR